MKRRGYGLISFGEVQALDDGVNIKVNRSFLYFAIARYNIINNEDMFNTVLPYILPEQENSKGLSVYKRQLRECSRYIKMLSQDARIIFGEIPQNAFWKTAFMTMPKLRSKTFSKNIE